MTRNQVTRFCTLSVKPWKEYFPWQPDDMPPKGGNPAALAKLLAEYGATENETSEPCPV